MIVVPLFSNLCLKDQLGLRLVNCHTNAMTGNCSAGLRVLAISQRMVSAMTGNLPLALVQPGSEDFNINRQSR